MGYFDNDSGDYTFDTTNVSADRDYFAGSNEGHSDNNSSNPVTGSSDFDGQYTTAWGGYVTPPELPPVDPNSWQYTTAWGGYVAPPELPPVDPNSLLNKIKSVAYNALEKVIDTLSLSNPITVGLNIASKMISGKTLGQWTSYYVQEGLAAGMSTTEAQEYAETESAKKLNGEMEGKSDTEIQDYFESSNEGHNNNNSDIYDPAMDLPAGNINNPGTGTPAGNINNPGTGTPAGTTTPNNMGIPANMMPGINDFVTGSNAITDQYNTNATGLMGEFKNFGEEYTGKYDNIMSNYQNNIAPIHDRVNSLWDDYLDFEKTYFDKYENVQNDYQNNLDSMPQMNLQMPGSMGGATVSLAPRVHSAMYGDQANTMKGLINIQGNAALAGMDSRNTLNNNKFTMYNTEANTMGNLVNNQGNIALADMNSRNSLNNNMFNTNQIDLTNSFMPTQTALDLYKLERAGELDLQQIDANQPREPSTLEKWAPIVGSLLTTPTGSDQTNLGSIWDTVTGFFD